MVSDIAVDRPKVDVCVLTPMSPMGPITSPGVNEELTSGVDVEYLTGAVIAFDLSTPSWRDVAAREASYFLIGKLEAIRDWILGEKSEVPRTAIALRWIYRVSRSALAKGVLLPDVAATSDAPGTLVEAVQPNTGFEISRRVFKFEWSSRPLICHVFAPKWAAATDRLLAQLADAIGSEPTPLQVCDRSSHLCLWSEPSARLLGRQIVEVVIAPNDALAKAGEHSVRWDIEMGISTEQGAIVDQEDASNAIRADLRSESTDAVLFKDVKVDLTFIMGEIDRAADQGVPLDDAFVRCVAEKRLELARSSFSYPDKPGAGPTIESSLGAVRNVLRAHQIAAQVHLDSAD